MPVSALPNLDDVYAKWEKRGPKGMSAPQNGFDRNKGTEGAKTVQNGDAEQVLRSGRQKWRDKFGDDIKPVPRKRARERKRGAVVAADTVSVSLATVHNSSLKRQFS